MTVAKPAADSSAADIADTTDTSSAATDLFSVHDFDVNISMDIAPGTASLTASLLTTLLQALSRDGGIMCRKLANYAQPFSGLCAPFLQIMHEL